MFAIPCCQVTFAYLWKHNNYTMKKIIILALSIPFVFAACKKKETKTNFDLLTDGKWKVSEVFIAKGDAVALDYYSTMLSCAKDNLYTFNKDYTITSDEGATKCDDTVKQVTTDGNWALTNSDKTFTIKNSKVLPLSGDQSMNIVTLDNSTLKLSKDTTIDYPGIGIISGTIHATFSKN
jgi:uncharacterized lipoprotein YehR (DUF1307 family)